MNKHLAALFVAILCVSTAGGQEQPGRSPDVGATKAQVSLAVNVASKARKGRLSRRKLILTLSNHAAVPLVLDRRHLFEGVMVRLLDRNKEDVGKIPVSPPRPPEDGDRVILAPGAEYKARFELGDLYESEIIDTLNAGPYTIQFCYRNSVPAELDGIAFSLLEICSEPQTIQ